MNEVKAYLKKIVNDPQEFWILFVISVVAPMFPYLALDILFESALSRIIGFIYMSIIGIELGFYGIWFGFIKKNISLIFTTRGIIKRKSYAIKQTNRKAALSGLMYLLMGISFIFGGIYILVN